MEREKLFHFGFLKNYLCFAGVVMIFLIPVYLEAYHLLKREVEENTRQTMEQGVKILTDEILAVNGIMIRFPSHQYYAYVRSLKAPEHPEDYYALYSVRNYLADITTALSLPCQTMVWFSNGIVVTPKTVFSRPEQCGYNRFHTAWSDSITDWFLTFSQEGYQYQFLEAERFFDWENGEYTGLPLVHTYSSPGGRERAVYVSIFDMEEIYDLTGLKNLENQAHVVIRKADTKELVYDNQVKVNGSGVLFQTMTGGAFLSLEVEIPKSYFTGQLKGMVSLAVVYLALFVLAAIVMAVVMAGRTAVPVHKIVNTLNHYTEEENRRDLVNYGDIEQSIRQMGDRSLAVLGARDKLNQELYGWLLREQIVNGLEGKKLEDLREAGAVVSGPFRLILVQGAQKEAVSSEELLKMIREKGLSPVFFCKARENLFVFIHGERQRSELEEKLYGLVAGLESVLKESCTVCASVPMTDLEHIHEKYQAGRYSMKFLSIRKVIFQEDFNSHQKTVLVERNLMENVKLTDLILNGQKSEAENIISRQWYQVSMARDYSLIEQLYYMQSALLNHLADRLGLEKGIDSMEYNDAISDMEERMLKATDRLCALALERKQDVRHEMARKIVDYIDLHYTDPEFYLGTLTEVFGVSDKTVTKMVRSYCNRSFSEYLGGLRIKKARELLENPELSMEAVAQKSGFGSENTFYKAFKRTYNVSPSIYRGNLMGMEHG